jgi:hypothetical protein
LRLIRAAGCFELARVYDHRRWGEVAQRAGMVDVQVGLNDVSNRIALDTEPAELGYAVLRLTHADAKHVRQRAPVGARVASDRQRIAAVDHDVPRRVADKEERHRYLHPTSLERAAAE